MSFLKKIFGDTFLLWGFVSFLVLACTGIYYGEKREKEEIYTYRVSLEDSENGQIPVSGKTSTITTLYAKYALLMDASNRRVLYEKSGYEEVPMASTTKIMTLLVTLENANLSDIVTISEYAASMPDVQLDVKKGEQYRLSDLLYSLMLESHNDVAVAIAEHVGGSVEGFATLMNEKAQSLGAYHTNFVTPNGLDAENHYTTAYDLALIASYALENENFLKIIQTSSYTFHEQSTGRSFTVNNKDRFLTSYEGAIGIKTGFTGKAGYCFVGAAKREDKCFVSVVLACGWPPNKTYKWKDTANLMDYGMENYNLKEILAAGTSFQSVAVENSIEEESVIPYVKDSVSLLLKEDEKVTYDIKLPKKIKAPVRKDETIGEISVKIDDEIYKILPLYSNEKRTEITYGYVLKAIIFRYFMLKSCP